MRQLWLHPVQKHESLSRLRQDVDCLVEMGGGYFHMGIASSRNTVFYFNTLGAGRVRFLPRQLPG